MSLIKIDRVPMRVVDIAAKLKSGEFLYDSKLIGTGYLQCAYYDNYIENLLLGLYQNNILLSREHDRTCIIRAGFREMNTIDGFYNENKTAILRLEGNKRLTIQEISQKLLDELNRKTITLVFFDGVVSTEVRDDMIDRFNGEDV